MAPHTLLFHTVARPHIRRRCYRTTVVRPHTLLFHMVVYGISLHSTAVRHHLQSPAVRHPLQSPAQPQPSAENDPHDGKRKCETLWSIFKIAHQKSRYIFDLYHRRREISKELYEFCLDQGYADRNVIAKWKKVRCLILPSTSAERMRSVASLARWEELNNLCREYWTHSEPAT